MKRISQNTKIIIETLNKIEEDKSIFFFLNKVDNNKVILDLIEKIEEKKEWQCIPYLTNYLFVSESPISKKALDTIDYLLSNIAAVDLLDLPILLRANEWHVQTHLRKWHSLTLTKAKELLDSTKNTNLAGLLSFHQNGYIREQAIRFLENINSGGELKFLLIGLNDWVPQIKIISEKGIEKRLTGSNLSLFIESLALLDKLGLKQRALSSVNLIFSRLQNYLNQEKNLDLLLKVCVHPDKDIRKTCLKSLISKKQLYLQKIIRVTCKDQDIKIRQLSFSFLSNLSEKERKECLEAFLVDKSSSLRKKALTLFCENKGFNYTETLLNFSLDPSTSIREFVRWKLKTDGSKTDLRINYLSILKETPNNKNLVVAILGLSETGSADDYSEIITHIESSNSSIQKACLKALSNLDAMKAKDLFLRKLNSTSASVSKAAQKAVISILPEISNTEILLLCDKLSNTLPDHIKQNIIFIVNKMSKWERLSYLLYSFCILKEDASSINLLGQHLRSWQDKYQATWQCTTPSKEQKELIAFCLKQIDHRLNKQMRSFLETIIS